MKFPDFSLILAVYLALLILGYLYNQLVAWAERQNYLEGLTWLSVVIGVAFTLALTALFSWQFALLSLGAFACSGLPMASGAIWRYVQQRKAGQESLRVEASDE